MPGQKRQESSSESSSSILLTFLNFFLFLRSAVVNILYKCNACFLYFKSSSSVISSELSVVLKVRAFLTEISDKLAVHLLLCLRSYSFYIRFRNVSKVFKVSTMCCYFYSRWWSFGKISKMAGTSLLLLESAAPIRGKSYEVLYIYYRMFLRYPSRWMDCVLKSVECTFCSMKVVVRGNVRQPHVPCCSILPK